MAERTGEAVVVEPSDPFEGGERDGSERGARTAGADEPGLAEADDRLGQGAVAGIAPAADRGARDRGSGPGQCQVLGVADREVLPRFKRSE